MRGSTRRWWGWPTPRPRWLTSPSGRRGRPEPSSRMRGTAGTRPPSSSSRASSSEKGWSEMAEVLVLVEHSDSDVKKVTGELLTLARQFGEPAAVWIGDGAADGQARLAEYGATKVYVATGADVNDYVAGPEADVLATLAGQVSPAVVLMASTGQNKEVAGRRAGKTDSGMLCDAVGLAEQDGKIVAEQSVFGGATVVHSAVKTGTPIVTVRPNSVGAEPA